MSCFSFLTCSSFHFSVFRKCEQPILSFFFIIQGLEWSVFVPVSSYFSFSPYSFLIFVIHSFTHSLTFICFSSFLFPSLPYLFFLLSFISCFYSSLCFSLCLNSSLHCSSVHPFLTSLFSCPSIPHFTVTYTKLFTAFTSLTSIFFFQFLPLLQTLTPRPPLSFFPLRSCY